MTAWIIDLCFLLVVPSAVWTAPVAPTVVEYQREIEICMPGVQPMDADVHLCSATELDSTFYITGFHLKRDLDRIGHIMLFGCDDSGNTENNDKVWTCSGKVKYDEHVSELPAICRKTWSVLYLATEYEPGLYLPEGIGFEVGKGTPVKWIVLVVHYTQIDGQVPKNETDYSGFILTITDIRQPHLAGHYGFSTFVSHPAHSISFVNVGCVYGDSIKLHLLAYCAHYHPPGKVAIAYRIRNGTWTEVGRVTDQQQQIYYNVIASDCDITVEFGDVLAVVYILVNDDNVTAAHSGHTEAEMWNFAIMYYVDGTSLPHNTDCVDGKMSIFL